jgi:predicted O-methyltransferase YrrM
MAKPTFFELMQTMRAFQEGRVLLAALELDLFTAVGGGNEAGTIAGKLKTDSRATAMLLDALAAVGALTKSGPVYSNTPETRRYLTAASPDNQRPALMHTVHVWKAWTTLTDCVRKGTAVQEPGVDAHDQDWTEAFIAAMHSNAENTAGEVARMVGVEKVRRLLDLGGGSGAYSIAFAKANPALTAEVLDFDAVLRIARKHIAAAGLSGRVTTRAGDMLRDELGQGFDLVLLSAICHMFGVEENKQLLKRCREALAPGGRVVIRDFILDPGKTSPKGAVLFALNMLVATRSGATYTEGEYREWLLAAGFRTVDRPDPAGDILIGTRR